MGASKIRKALGAVKDRASIGLARVGSSSAVSDLQVAIVKATRHDEYPAKEKHVREILSLTCYSRSYVGACVNALSGRLRKTSCWTVALKTLVLINRLLSDGDPAYEHEIFSATRGGTRMLNMAEFRDASRSDSWDYSAFVRTYALYVEQRLEYRIRVRHRRRRRSSMSVYDGEGEGEEGEECVSVSSSHATPVREMKTERIFVRTQHLQKLLERFLACRPTGGAKNSRIVAVALYPLVKESFQLYYDVTEIMGIFIDRFMELQVPDCVKIHAIFRRLSKQFHELHIFYTWCKTAGISRSSDFPTVDKITTKKLEVMDQFIRDKSALEQSKKLKTLELPKSDPTDEVVYEGLPAPESNISEVLEEKQIIKVGDAIKGVGEEADLLDLIKEVAETRKEHDDRLALALFDVSTPATAAPVWEAFKEEESGDWETALVESASGFSSKKPAFGSGFDVGLLENTYGRAQEGRTGGFAGSGSASSMVASSRGAVAMGPMLELRKASGKGGWGGGDPFAASLAVAPPAYVGMWEMEKKQRLVVEEQVMWEEYARGGMQGQMGMSGLGPSMGGYRPMF